MNASDSEPVETMREVRAKRACRCARSEPVNASDSEPAQILAPPLVHRRRNRSISIPEDCARFFTSAIQRRSSVRCEGSDSSELVDASVASLFERMDASERARLELAKRIGERVDEGRASRLMRAKRACRCERS